MIPSIAVFVVTYVLIASERVDKTIAAILGASVVIIFRLVPYERALSKVDLNVIYLLLGMMIIVNILGSTGFFEWIAVAVAQKARGDSIKLISSLLLVTAFLSAWLDNVTTIILIAPVTILMTQILEIPAAPILILEAIFSNIGGTSTLVGDPPNIIIGSQSHLYFKDFIVNLGPIIIVIALISLAAVLLFLRNSMKVSNEARRRLAEAQAARAIVNAPRLRKALPILGLVIVGFFFSHALEVETGLLALAGAFVMILICRVEPHEVLAKVEWNALLFFVGLFMLIGCLEYNGTFTLLGNEIVHATRGNLLLCAMVILWCSALASAIVDNIPLVISMIPLIKTVVPAFAMQMGLDPSGEATQRLVAEPLYWSLALGACLGGNGSLVGASANVVVAQIARRNKYRLTFMDFTAYGLPMMLVSLVCSTIYIYLRYFR